MRKTNPKFVMPKYKKGQKVLLPNGKIETIISIYPMASGDFYIFKGYQGGLFEDEIKEVKE